MREAIYFCPNNYSSDDDDKLVSIVAVSIFAVRSRKWTQFSRMDKQFPPKRLNYACRSPRWFKGYDNLETFRSWDVSSNPGVGKKNNFLYRLYAQELEND